MAYRITYQWNRERELTKGTPFPMVWALAALCASAALRLLVPELPELLQGLVYPLADPETVSALAEMVDRMGSGIPPGDALTAFCREILSHAA